MREGANCPEGCLIVAVADENEANGTYLATAYIQQANHRLWPSHTSPCTDRWTKSITTEYKSNPFTIRYDTVYLTCSQVLTGSQLSLLHGIKQKS